MKKFIIAVVIIIILGLAGFLVWLYTGSLTPAQATVFKKTGLPIALINYRLVSGTDFIERTEIAQSLAKNNPGYKATEVNKQILDQIIDNKKLEIMAKKQDVVVTSSALDQEYQAFVDNFAQGDSDKFKNVLQETYHLSPDQFKKKIIYPDLLLSTLTVWHNQQENLNAESYNKANNIKAKIDSGQPFTDVAKELSDDTSTKEFGGDAGFVTGAELLPEFQDALRDTKPGDVKLIISRFGLHWVNVVEVDSAGESPRYHLQQVFVKIDNFSDWYGQQTNSLKVRRLIKV